MDLSFGAHATLSKMKDKYNVRSARDGTMKVASMIQKNKYAEVVEKMTYLSGS